MNERFATGLALAVLLAAATGPTIVAVRRGHRFLSPTVVFPLTYVFMTGGPSLWFLLTGWYYAGVIRSCAIPVLLSCASGIVAFQIGSWSMASRKGLPCPVFEPSLPRDKLVRVWSLALLAGALSVYALASLRMRQEVGPADKSAMLSLAAPTTLRAYTLAAAAIQVLGLIVVAADSRGRPGRPSMPLMAVLLVHGGLCLWNQERDVVFLVLGWLVLNAHVLGRRAIPVAAALIVFVAAIPVLRMAANAPLSTDRPGSGRQMTFLAGSLMTQTSSNFFVFTNVVDWVPNWSEFRRGRTYTDAVASFFPEFLTGERHSLAGWFKSRYAPTSTTGYGFGMDAEGYLNFGWMGPPLVFLVWGLLLGWIYRRAEQPGASSFFLFLWVLALAASLYAVRMETRVLLKLVVLGAISGGSLYLLAGVPSEISAISRWRSGAR